MGIPAANDEQAWLKFVEDEQDAFRAVQSEVCPVSALEKAIKLFPECERQICYNRSAPSNLLERAYANATMAMTRSSIVEHKNATPKIIRLAVEDADVSVRVSAAKVALEEDLLVKLARDPSNQVRFNLARNQNASPKILELLLVPYERNVAAGILENKNCTEVLFAHIAEQPFVKNDETGITGTWTAEPLLRMAKPGQLEEIFNRVPESERYYVLKNPNASEEMIFKMFEGIETLYDQECINSLLNRESVSDELLLLALKKVRPESRGNFAYFKPMTKSLFDSLVHYKSLEMNLALIENPTVNGNLLLGFLKDKSKKIQNALASRTYKIYEPGSFLGKDVKFEGRDDLWQALDGGIPVQKFKLSLEICGCPISAEYPGAWLENWNTPVEFLVNASADSAAACISEDLAAEFRTSPLSELLEFDVDDELENNDLIGLNTEGSSVSYYKHTVLEDGNWDILYGQNVEVSFTLAADNLEKVRSISTEHVLKYIKVQDGEDNSFAAEVFRIYATVQLDQVTLCNSELWYEDQEVLQQIDTFL